MFKKWFEENSINNYDFSGEIFPKAKKREFWESKYDKKYIDEAEKYLNCDWPIIRATAYKEYLDSGNRIAGEKNHFTRRRAMISLVLGELLEYKGRFLPDILDGIFAICEESFWGITAHKIGMCHKTEILPDVKNHYIDLFAAETAELLAVVYHLFYDELNSFCPEIIERMEYEFHERIIKPYLTHKDFWWMGYYSGVNNWNPWILSNILTVILLVTYEKSVFNTAIEKMIYEIDAYYKGMPDDGGCDEGTSYWCVAGGKLFEFCDLLYTATNGKIDLFNDEKIRNIGRFIYRTYIGGGYFVNYADGTSRISASSRSVLYLYGKRIGDERLSALAKEQLINDTECGTVDREAKIKRCLNNIIYDSDIKALSDYVPEESSILPDLQTAYVRKGEWYYSAKGGTNLESHNHVDVGSFIVYFKNQPILVDPSCGTYTRQTFSEERYNIWTMQSAWHNLPVINGFEQMNEHDEDFKLIKADFKLNGKTTRIGFEKMYSPKACLKSAVREINPTDSGIEICDSFEFSGNSNNISEHFITPKEVKACSNRIIISNEYVLEPDTDCEFVLDSVDFCGDSKLIRCWNTEKLNRIKCIFSCGEKKEVKFRISRIIK